MATYVDALTDHAKSIILPLVTNEWEDFQTITDRTDMRFSQVVPYLAYLKNAGLVINDGRNWKLA